MVEIGVYNHGIGINIEGGSTRLEIMEREGGSTRLAIMQSERRRDSYSHPAVDDQQERWAA